MSAQTESSLIPARTVGQRTTSRSGALDMVSRLQCSGRQPRHKILHTPLPGENGVALDIAELVITSSTAFVEVAIKEAKLGTGRIVAGLYPLEIASIEMRSSEEPMHWQFSPEAMELSVAKKKPCNRVSVY
jgi:hypothetical protein